MLTTNENLELAFSEEGAASAAHGAAAAAADKEGLSQVAKLFRAVARSEAVRAARYLSALGGVGIAGRKPGNGNPPSRAPSPDFYSAALEQAIKEGHPACVLLRSAPRVGELRAGLLERARRATAAAADLPEAELRVCPICGYVALGDIYEKCPVCGARPHRFEGVS